MTRTPVTSLPASRIVSRRSLLASTVVVPLIAVVAAACGDDSVEPASSSADTTAPGSSTPPSVGIDHPSDPTAAVLRVAYEGGFMMAGADITLPPTLVISGDGMVYAPGATTLQFPGPMVLPIGVRTITEAGIQRVLEAARSAGLLSTPPEYPRNDMIADAPDTVVTIAAGGGVFVHRAYALGIEEAESDPGRAALQAFVLAVSDLAAVAGEGELGQEELLVPKAFRMRATPVTSDELASIDPKPTVAAWPTSTGVDLAAAASCTTLTAEAAGTVFGDADSNTFFEQGGVTYRVVAGALLPGDPVCE
jgi:hypothetical protein